MSSRLRTTAAVAVAIFVALGSSPAAAAPVNAKNAETLAIDCEHLGTVLVVVNGNGEWTPGHVVDGGPARVGIPYAFRFEGTFTPADGSDPEVFVEETSKPAPHSGRLDVCTFSESETDETGTFEANITVWISYTPGR